MNAAIRYDTIIAGGGPAGLSAALVLGRCRRRVLVCDTGKPRNQRSKAMHGFLSRDGTPPAEFAEICRAQLRDYPGVELRSIAVLDARREGDHFAVELGDGSSETSRTLLLATGIVDDLPKIEGFDRFYGRTAHHCPYCDGWEHRDQPLAVVGCKVEAADLAIELLLWSKDLVLCTDGPPDFSAEKRLELDHLGIRVIEAPIAALEGEGDVLGGIRFRDGRFLARAALFFSPGQKQHSPLAERLGCELCEAGSIQCAEDTETCVPGLYAAGNASRGLQLVIIAAAEGTRSAFAINERLCQDDRAHHPATNLILPKTVVGQSFCGNSKAANAASNSASSFAAK
jgi:thioredoxin reductase